MKKIIIVLLVLAAVVCGAILIVHPGRQQTSPAPTPDSESTAPPAEQPSTEKTMVAAAQPQAAAADVTIPAPMAAPARAGSETNVNEAAALIHKAVDGLLTAKSAAEKHALFDQLRKSGQLDQVIAELKQRAGDNPNDAEIPTTMGEALLNKVRALHEAGGDTDDLGILAMQADQSFNSALKIDPANWEAQFVKAASMFYWPADPTRDADVVQRLSNLIDQQERKPPQPEFAQPYYVLGNEYQKIGQPDKALATWQLGLQKFPGDTGLQNKINGR